MKTITAKFRIVTPMFIAGSRSLEMAEIRAPSIKGVLRFWWRVLSFDQAKDENGKFSFASLKNGETNIFGDPNTKGQSRFLLKLDRRLTGRLSGNGLLDNDCCRKYLGYGLFAMGKNNKERFAIPDNKEFSMEMCLKRSMREDQVLQLKRSIMAMGLLGGLGSRSRRGFGSLAITRFDESELKFESLEDYKKSVESIFNLETLSSNHPPYTAASKNMIFAFGPIKSSSESAHRFIGNLYKQFRSIRKHEPRKRFFGLPLRGDEYDSENRRASPLFFHIHPIGKGFVPVVFFIPADFHPKYEKYDYSLVSSFIRTI